MAVGGRAADDEAFESRRDRDADRYRDRSRSPARDGFGGDGGAPPAPSGGDGPPGGRGDVRPGDWTCNGCGANVFASKTACFRCQAPKPGFENMGGGGKGGAGGDVRPGDWTCPGCGANVFASKNSCFRCQTPRPAGVGGIGAPIGAGGAGESAPPPLPSAPPSVAAQKVNANMQACCDAYGCLARWCFNSRPHPACMPWCRWWALLNSRNVCMDAASGGDGIERRRASSGCVGDSHEGDASPRHAAGRPCEAQAGRRR